MCQSDKFVDSTITTKNRVCGGIFFCILRRFEMSLYTCEAFPTNAIHLVTTIYKMTFLRKTLQYAPYYYFYKAAFFSM